LRVYEYEGKRLLAENGIPVPNGIVVTNSDFVQLPVKFPVVLKAQVLTANRAEMGWIRFANTLAEVKSNVESILDPKRACSTIGKVLVEERLEVQREIYVAITLDRKLRQPTILLNRQGGTGIESLEKSGLLTLLVNPIIGLRRFQLRDLCSKLSLDSSLSTKLSETIEKLYFIFGKYCADLLEVNPLALTSGEEFIPLDVKLTIDDFVISKFQGQLEGDLNSKTFLEMQASQMPGLSAFPMDGNGDIGIISMGAGSMILIIDLIHSLGGRISASFDMTLMGTPLDKMFRFAISLAKDHAKAKVLVVNLLTASYDTSMTASTFANLMVDIFEDIRIPEKPIVLIRGKEAEKTRKFLESKNIRAPASILEACEMAVKGRT
jgi:succinyl-CoA synthetase beta subunit